MELAEKEERELICIDESIFSSKSNKRKQWAPIGSALEWDKRFQNDKWVAVCAASSVKSGMVHYTTLLKEAYTTKTFMKFMRALHNKCSKKSIAILIDNCGIHDHKTPEFIEYCDKRDIVIIWNIKYRPDLNGIEFVWKWAKKEYRSWVDWFRANGMNWNETQLVEIIMDSIPTDVAVKETKRGFANIKAA